MSEDPHSPGAPPDLGAAHLPAPFAPLMPTFRRPGARGKRHTRALLASSTAFEEHDDI